MVPAAPDYADEISDKRFAQQWRFRRASTRAWAAGEQTTVKMYDYKGDLKSGIAMREGAEIFNDIA